MMEFGGVSERKPLIPQPQQQLLPLGGDTEEPGRSTPDISFTNISRSNSPLDPSLMSFKNSRIDNKLCGVCGDKALGNNFNAITCESCKAFFRRNALKQKEFACPFNDNCKVDPITRRFCQKCRLKKCFEIGMKKEWIMTDEEKKLKKRKIEQNRVKRQNSDVSFDTPPAKALCLSPPGEEEEVFKNASNQHSPPDQTLPPQMEKQPMMPHVPSGADSTTHYDHVGGEEDMAGGLQICTNSNIDHSPSSSNSSAEMNVGYMAPASGMMTPLNMSQIEAAQLITKSNSTGQNGQMANHQIEMENHAMNSMWAQHPPPDFQPFHWHDEVNNQVQQQRHYTMSPAMMYPSRGDRETTRDISPQIVTGAQSNKAMHYSVSSGSQMKSIIPPPSQISSNQTYQMPLLSSLMRPGEAESPPDCNSTSSMGIGNQFQRNNGFGGGVPSYEHEMKQTSQPIESHQILPTVIRPPPSHHFTCHSTNPYRPQQDAEDDIPPPLPLNTMDSIVSVAIRAEFNSFGMLCKPQESMGKDLNGAEVAKLQELLMACEALGDPVDQEGPLKLSKHSDPTLINVINLTDIAIRRLIKMSKKISGFKNMCQEDQIALLKGGCTEMMILRSVVTYDPDRDSWKIPHSYGYNIKLGVLKEARGNLYEEHQRFVKSFKPEWRVDENIMILLCAITLFTAERPNVIHKDVVKLEQDSYYYLLKRYLESMLNGCEARSTYLLLIRKIAELRILNSTHLRVFLEVNPREVEPLLREVFSMV